MSSRLEFEIVRYRQMATREDCYNALPNNTSAVYAWFRDLTLPDDVLTSETKFVNTVMELFESSLSEKQEGRVGPFYEVDITAKPKNLTQAKEEALRHYAKTETIRNDIGRALRAATLLQAPLYIGKAGRLAYRIWRHVSRNTALCDRIEKAGLSLQDCLLAYVPVPNLSDVDIEQMRLVQLVEDIITRLSRPGFVLRIG